MDNKQSLPGGIMAAVGLRRFRFFTLWTKDLAAARKFYSELLGFPVVEEKAGEFFQVEIGGVPVCVDLHARYSGTQSNQIGVEVEDLAATVEFLRGQGLEIECGERPGAERWAIARDPDGHEIIFIAGPGQ
jgi:catechol 2,3-dioxygenase-like lactoylglutathione lyase family enzyme